MKSILLMAGLVAALGGILVLVLFSRHASRAPEAVEAAPVGTTTANEAPETGTAPQKLRAYRTLYTLREDLRDALPAGGSALAAEFWRVSTLYTTRDALRVLNEIAPGEKSPRVRGLLVLAAGVHLPDHESLLRLLGDRSAVVREAAVLATTHSKASKGEAILFLNAIRVQPGRRLAEPTRRALEAVLSREVEDSVRRPVQRALADR